MMFCPKCGGILMPNEKNKKIKCRCGYTANEKAKISVSEELKKDKKDFVEVVDKKYETLPKTKEECPKCGNMTAYFWTIQTRAGDEAETRFFECTKCKNRWRSYV